jgi:type VI secretion system protein VasD
MYKITFFAMLRGHSRPGRPENRTISLKSYERVRPTQTRRVLALAAALGTACASDPPPPAPTPAVAAPATPAPPAAPPPAPPPPATRVELAIEALPDINPDGTGRPSPLLVRVYQLKTVAAFEGADFFALYQNEPAVLAADLVHKAEFMLRPGERRPLDFEPRPEASALAAFAAFRNLDTAVWRATTPLTPHQTHRIELRIGGNRIGLATLPPPPETKPAAPLPASSAIPESAGPPPASRPDSEPAAPPSAAPPVP